MIADAVLQELKELHRPFRIYDFCGHKHAEGEPGVKEIDVLGYVCEAGYAYDICGHCCCDDSDEMSEACASGHEHGPTLPRCATIAIVEKEPA